MATAVYQYSVIAVTGNSIPGQADAMTKCINEMIAKGYEKDQQEGVDQRDVVLEYGNDTPRFSCFITFRKPVPDAPIKI